MKFLGEIENIHDVVNKSYVESLIEGTATDIASQLISEALQDNATQTWVNQQGFLTEHQDLSGYLPLSGGTMTGQLTIKSSTTAGATPKLYFQRGTTADGNFDYYIYCTSNGLIFGNSRSGTNYNLVKVISTALQPINDNTYNLGASDYKWNNIYTTLINGGTPIHSGNYSSYALPLSGGTITGDLFLKNTYLMWQTPSNGNGGYFTGQSFNAHTNQGYTAQIFTWGTDGILTFKSTPKVGSNTIWHEGNFTPSDYLPLSGGTMTGPITLTSGGSSAYKKTALSFTNADGSREDARIGTSTSGPLGIYSRSIIYLKPNNPMNAGTTTGIMLSNTTFTYNDYKVWHEGNDGADSGLDADLLDGIESSYYFKGIYNGSLDFNSFADGSNDNNFYYVHAELSQSNRPPFKYGGLLNLGIDSMNAQIGIAAQDVDEVYVRTRWWSSNGGTWRAWKQIAFTDSNVASATKLQTARTIWGQSFDGTGNVSGTLHITTHSINTQYSEGIRINALNGGYSSIWLNTTNANGYDAGMWGITAMLGGNLRFRGGSTSASDLMVITKSGNVGIGTTSPAQKFHVNGNVLLTNGSYCLDASIIANTNGIGYALYGNNPSQYGVTMSQTSGYGNHGNISDWATYFCMNTYNASIVRGWIFRNSYTNTNVASIDTSGNILASGGITQYSDIRKKTKLNDVELTLKQVADAPLIEHYYNSDDKKTTHVGSIAQYWAGLNDWFCKLDSDGFYTMEIQNAALASTISIARELERYESKTDKKIRMLKKRINELEDEIEKLKSA